MTQPMAAGNAPSVLMLVDSGPFAPGAAIGVTLTIVDADNVDEVLHSVDDLGRAVTVDINRVDPETLTWSWRSGAPIQVSGQGPFVVEAPSASDTLQVTVTDGQQNVASASSDVDVQGPMQIGSDAVVMDLVKYPKLAYSRRFASGGLDDLSDVPLSVTPHVSINSGGVVMDMTVISQWLSSHPTRHGFITIDHEVNTGHKATPAIYKQNNIALANLLASHPNGHQWKLVEIYGLYQQNHIQPKWDAYTLTTDPATEDMVYAIGWDCYVEAAQQTFPPVSQFFAPIMPSHTSTGKPLMVPELGFRRSVMQKLDPDGHLGAQWLTDCVNFLRANNFVAVAEWDNPAGDPSFVLSGLALQAWQTAVATQ